MYTINFESIKIEFLSNKITNFIWNFYKMLITKILSSASDHIGET